MKNLLAYTPEPFDNLEAEFGEMGEGELGRRSRRPLRRGTRIPPSYLRNPRPHWQRRDYAPRLPTIPLWLIDDDDNGDDCIRWVQDCLNRVLKLQLPLDGLVNRETKSALREFQRRYGLPVSGVVEVETEAELIVQSIDSLLEAEEDLFLRKAVRGISRAAKTVSRAARDVSKVAAQGVKFAGKAYKTASSLTQPIGPKLLTRFGKDVLSGKNVVNSFRSTVKSGLDDVRNRIKYVQMAASFVPGIGTGVSAALGAANALASGRPITAALIEAARGAIPGGPFAQTAFDMGMNLARGQNISTAALNAAKNRLPPAARAAFDTAVALGRGQSLQQAALGAVRNRLPAGGRAAFDTAVALGRGQSLQQAALGAVRNRLPAGGRAAFDTAVALGRGQSLQQAVLANAGRMMPKSPYANRALAGARYADAQSRRFRDSPQKVRWIQESLNKILGLRLKIDGIMGPQTRSAIRSFQQKSGLVVDGIAGPKTEAAIKAAARKVQTPPTEQSVRQAMDFFVSQGWTAAQAAGIVANLQAESGLRPDAVGDHGQAYGIAQWHPDRQAAFQRFSGRAIQGSTFEEQLRFVHYELTRGGEVRAGNRLRNAKSANDAGSIVSRYYERPADRDGAATRRGRNAERILNNYQVRQEEINKLAALPHNDISRSIDNSPQIKQEPVGW